VRSRREGPAETSSITEAERRRRRATKRRQARRRAAIAVVVMAALVALVGVGLGFARGGRSAPGSKLPSTPPRSGGTLTVSFDQQPAGLDPAVAQDTEAQSIERLVYQTLLTYASKPGEAGTALVPDLATEVPTVANRGISGGGKVYTFHLKPHAGFAPPVSAPVTAADVKWSIERMLRQPMAPAKSFYTGIVGAQAYMDDAASSVSGLEAVDRSTLRITLDAPDAAFLHRMALPFTSVLSKTWCAKVGTQIDRRPLGSGPYMLQTWTSGKRLEAVRNPGFALQGAQNAPWIDKLAFVFVPGHQALLGLERGEIDLLGEGVPQDDYASTRGSEWGGYVVDAPRLAGQYLFMNVNEAPFNAVNVRRAVSYAIDRERIQTVADGHAVPLDQIYPAGLPGHEAGRQFYAHDPAKAKYLLARAGYPHGLTTTLYTDGVDPQPALAEAIKRDLAAVGIRVQVTTLSPTTYWSFVSLMGSKAPLVLANWYQDFPDPSDWIGPLFTEPVDGGADFSFYQRGGLTKLFGESNAELDGARRLEQFRQMQDIAMKDAPVTPLIQPVWHGMCGKDVGGFYVHPVTTLDFRHYWKTGGR
jgi:peptide/nickel transport system substrate-binding protein